MLAAFEAALADLVAAAKAKPGSIAIGTSGAVYPAAGLVEDANRAGIRTCEINLTPSDNANRFDEARYGPASEAVPNWVAEVMDD